MVYTPQLFRIMKNIGLKIAKLLKNVTRCKQSSTIGESETKPEWKQKMHREGSLKNFQNPRFQVNHLATEDPAAK